MRRAVLRSLLAVPLVVGAGYALLRGLPGLVREQLATRVKARTGLQVAVGDVSVGFSSVTVAGIDCGTGSGVRVRMRDMVLDASPIMLALRGTSALGAVRIGELATTLPLHAPQTKALIERLRGGGGGDRGPVDGRANDGGVESISVQQLKLDVRDAQGTLVVIEGGSVDATAERMTIALPKVQIGGGGGTSVVLSGVSGRLQRTAAGLRVTSLAVANMKLAAQAGADEDDAGDADLSGASGLLRRLLAATDVLRSTGAAKPVGARGADASHQQTSVMEKFAVGAELRLKDGAVLVKQGAPPAMHGLSAKASVLADGSLTFAGSGKAQGGGALSWDLALRPEQAQADGRLDARSIPLSLIAPFLPSVPWHEPEQGRLDAELVVATEPEQGVKLSGEVTLRDAGLSSPRLAPVPVRDLQLTLVGKGRLLPLQSRLEVSGAEIRVRGVALKIGGAIEWTKDHYLFDVDAQMPQTPCTDAVKAIPEELLGEMALATWQGKLGGTLKLRIDSRKLEETVLEIAQDDHCEFLTVPAMADLRRFQMPFVHSVLEPDGALFELETGPGTAAWTYIEDTSPFLVHAVLAHEDAGFFSHHGFSLLHVRNALVRNLQAGRYVVGASTITMQLVKNVFLHREKTLARKIQEVLLTWWIERVMDKRDILELYLNVIEYGPGIYGLRNGARHYFNRLPSQLSPAEAVYLSTILPNPKRYHSHFEKGALTPSWGEQMRRILLRLRDRGSFDKEAAAYGLSELSAFRFVPEGSIVAPRIVPGGTQPLPYMRGYGQAADWQDEGSDFGDDEGLWPTEQGDDLGDEPRRPAPKSAPAHVRP